MIWAPGPRSPQTAACPTPCGSAANLVVEAGASPVAPSSTPDPRETAPASTPGCRLAGGTAGGSSSAGEGGPPANAVAAPMAAVSARLADVA